MRRLGRSGGEGRRGADPALARLRADAGGAALRRPRTLAVGADLKNTCAVAEGRHLWLSQHIGDMDDLATIEAFAAIETHLEKLTGVRPGVFVCDDHPGLPVDAMGPTNAAGRPVRSVQHHHAHIASVMGEHGLDGTTPVLGFAFDGTGYGPDHAIWGGEVLITDYLGFQRMAHLAYVPLAGGDASVERPYRMALSHLRAAGIAWADDLPPVVACPPTSALSSPISWARGSGVSTRRAWGGSSTRWRPWPDCGRSRRTKPRPQCVLESVAASTTGAGDYRFDLCHAADGALTVQPAGVLAAVVRDLRAGETWRESRPVSTRRPPTWLSPWRDRCASQEARRA